MDIISKGQRTFTQSYNPNCIVVGERKPKNEIVYSVYSSLNNMPAGLGAAYRVAVARKIHSREKEGC